MRVLLTGSCGYVGSVLSYFLLQNKIEFVGLDNLSNASIKILPGKKKLYVGDIADKKLLNIIDEDFAPDCIIHLAANISVEESEKKKKEYLINNFQKSKVLFNFFSKKRKLKFFFASTAAVYSNNYNLKYENLNEKPSNYYGYTKKIFENFLLRQKNKNLNIKIFRFFNIVGSHKNILAGNKSIKSDHLVNNLCKSLINKKKFIINGTNYSTKDGSAMRDFIDVNDLCKIIIFFLKKKSHFSPIYNLATGKSYSVKEVFDLFSKISKAKLNYIIGDNRKGDAFKLVCSNKKLKKVYKKRFYSLQFSLKNHLKFYRINLRNIN